MADFVIEHQSFRCGDLPGGDPEEKKAFVTHLLNETVRRRADVLVAGHQTGDAQPSARPPSGTG